MKQWTGAAFFFSILTSATANDSLVSIGDHAYLAGNPTGGKITYLRYPTLGCPAIVKAGDTGVAWIKLADGGTTTGFAISIVPTGDAAGATYALPVVGVAFDAPLSIYKVTYQVPASVPDDTYDFKLSIPSLAVSDIQYNSCRIVKQEASTYTFLVISDTHFNDPQGWFDPANKNLGGYNAFTIIEQMKKEMRALNPTFVILTGDLTFGIDYDFEFEGLWNVWKDAGVPIFMVPGNHDAYACIEDRWFLGLHSPVRDGLEYWRKYVGPTYFSFQFGGVHLQAVNSGDGTPARRDGFLFIIENYGGDLLVDQMNWISADLAGTVGTVVPFMHHNPMGPYRPNGTFQLETWVLTWLWKWITTGEFANWPSQEWNTQATGEFLLSQYAAVPTVFIGHSHKDAIETYNSTTYKLVTSGGSNSQTYWGYTRVRVENAQITDYLYLDAQHQSIPTGNLHVTVTDAEGPTQAAKIESGLSKSYDVTIEFVMPTAGEYAATNGTVVQVAPIDAATSKVWVRAPSPVATNIQAPQSVEVSVTGTGASGPVGGSVETPPAATGGCGMIGIEALFLMLLLGAVRLRR